MLDGEALQIFGVEHETFGLMRIFVDFD